MRVVFRNCQPGSIDSSKVKGHIILCFDEIGDADDAFYRIEDMIDKGALGAIMVDDDLKI